MTTATLFKSPSRAIRRPRNPHAIVGRRIAQRLTRETLLSRAEFLPPVPRALLTAHFDLGMSFDDLAMVHRTTPPKIRRCINRLRDTLSDPCFLLAARFAAQLPAELATLARDHWIEGKTLRQMATARHQTLHRIRRDIDVARSLLVLAMSTEQTVPPELARAAITGHPSPHKDVPKIFLGGAANE